MFDTFVASLTPFLASYGSFAVFLFSFLEEIIAPIPSAIVLLGAGFFILPPDLNFNEILMPLIFKIILPASVGISLGSLFIYIFTYLGGKPFIKRWGMWFGISWEKIEEIENRFIKGSLDELLLFGLRAFPLVPNILISSIAGILRYPIKEFIFFTFLGSIMRAFFMGVIGWWVGEAYIFYADRFTEAGTIIFISVGILMLGFVIYHILKKIRK